MCGMTPVYSLFQSLSTGLSTITNVGVMNLLYACNSQLITNGNILLSIAIIDHKPVDKSSNSYFIQKNIDIRIIQQLIATVLHLVLLLHSDITVWYNIHDILWHNGGVY